MSCMIRANAILSTCLVVCLLPLAVMAEVQAGSKGRARVQISLATPSVIAVITKSGPWGLPGMLTSTDVIIGDAAVSYIDPEFLPEDRLMVW